MSREMGDLVLGTSEPLHPKDTGSGLTQKLELPPLLLPAPLPLASFCRAQSKTQLNAAPVFPSSPLPWLRLLPIGLR